jgi:hypothetical protein
MSGTVTGGWGFVIAAYSITGIVLFGYLGSVIQRLRAEKRAQAVADEAAELEQDVSVSHHTLQATP